MRHGIRGVGGVSGTKNGATTTTAESSMQHAGVAMVGVIVVGPMAHDDVGLPLADERATPSCGSRATASSSPSWMSRTSVLDAEDPRALRDFRFPAARQRPAGLVEMTDVSVGHRHELDLVARAAQSAATPLAFSSASSGCAPKAMIRRGVACACSARPAAPGITTIQMVKSSIVTEQSFHVCGLAGNAEIVRWVEIFYTKKRPEYRRGTVIGCKA